MPQQQAINPVAILGLLSDLYAQIQAQQERIAELERELKERG